MSWTTTSLLINEGPPGYLGTFPTYQANKARSLLLENLGVKYSQSRFSNFGAGIRPPSGWFCIGAYENAVLISGYRELYGMVEESKTSPVTALLKLFAGADVLCFELAGGTGYFGFELRSAGQVVRAVTGDPERGIVRNEGTLTPEERSLGLNGNSSAELVDHGETVVFELTKRFFGVRLDKFSAEKLVVELIKERSALLSRFLA